jgi:hypothetical protein
VPTRASWCPCPPRQPPLRLSDTVVVVVPGRKHVAAHHISVEVSTTNISPTRCSTDRFSPDISKRQMVKNGQAKVQFTLGDGAGTDHPFGRMFQDRVLNTCCVLSHCHPSATVFLAPRLLAG